MARIEAQQIKQICPDYDGPNLDTTGFGSNCHTGNQPLSISQINDHWCFSYPGCHLHPKGWLAAIAGNKLKPINPDQSGSLEFP